MCKYYHKATKHTHVMFQFGQTKETNPHAIVRHLYETLAHGTKSDKSPF